LTAYVKDIETNSKVDLDTFINKKGIVVLYFRSHKISVTPKIEPVLHRVIEKWRNKGVSIGICNLGISLEGLKIGEYEIHFYHLPLFFLYHSGELKYTLQTLVKDEDFEEVFVKMFNEYKN
jgi:hypothetical protein